MISSIVIGGLSLAFIGYSYKSGKSLNPLTQKVKSADPFKFADKFKDKIEDKAEEKNQIGELKVSQLDNLLSHAVAHGREIERAKGQDSETLLTMVKISLLLSGLNLLGIAILIFG